MKRIFLTMTALFTLSAIGASAQVTIGSLADPQSFSILELEGKGERGLRLPQLDTDQRDALVSLFAGHETEALGLQIFNTDTQCVETWNGIEWIQACYNNTPTPPPAPLSAVSCGITNTGATVFTAKVDPYAVKYEFFDNGSPQGKQTSNSIDFKTARTVSEITVRYYYPLSFLKPKMVEVEGNDGSEWKYGESNTGTNVTIPDLQWAETEITQAQFEYVFPDRAGVTTCDYNQPSYNFFSCSNTDEYIDLSEPSSSKPADMISWYDAIAYCNKLSAMEGKTPVYTVSGVDDWLHFAYTSIPSETDANWHDATCNFTADGYRLPTSSEWEYAARGGVKSSQDYIYSGSDIADDVAWYSGNVYVGSKYSTHPVKTKVANVFGLYDMSGNVWEWCWNQYDDPFPQATPTGDAVGSEGSSSYHILRGGGWSDDADGCCVSLYIDGYPSDRSYVYGFRVVCRRD
ncbi:MAG: formylglycine-generating enzyme family protein [Dysgonamonadaceae bacterium]|jgi:formylglycine-generating enzyme required for sulfatase activity|nr:formylglycine-generating enzyme family protein [Dysgonamonadaceae bacterium]